MTNFKTIKNLKVEWLKNASEHGGAMELVIDSKPINNIVVHSKTVKHGRMWADIEHNELINLCKKDNGIYEVLSNYPYKVYFDIDCKTKSNDHDADFEHDIINKITEIFPDNDLAISGSVTDEKTSYHIVLNNYIIKNNQERDYIKMIVKHLNETFDDCFDWKVYNKNRNMKAVNQSKGDGRIQKIIYNDDIKKHFITCFLNEVLHELPQFEQEDKQEIKLSIDIEKAKKPFNIGSLPKTIMIKKDITNFNIDTCTPINILFLLPLDNTFNHAYTHYIARFCFYNGLTFEEFINWYGQKSTTQANINKWAKHWTQLNKFSIVTVNSCLILLMKYYPTIRRDNNYKNFINMFDLDNTKQNKVDNLNQDIFNNENKFLIVNTGMGSGKTFQTLKYLQNQESFIWMTPIEALAQNTKFRLEQDNIDCKYYKDFKNKQDKDANMSKFDRLIICINSLPYTKTKYYKIVVIDEIETLLNKWFNNSTFKDNKIECWTRFLDIIRNADKVIFLDAFISKLTTDFITSLKNGDYNIIERTNETSNRELVFIKDFDNWLNNIIKEINANKKPFIFYPYLRKCKGLPSMEELKEIITKLTNKTGVAYNSQTDDEILKGLKNVNHSWSLYNFVITNTKITVGINYELKDFDSVYLSIAGFSGSRDIIQVSYRCRELKTNKINVCFIDKYNSLNAFENDDITVNNCNVYKSMVSNILYEKKAPLKQSFMFLANKANYKLSSDKNIIYEGLKDYFKKLFEENTITHNYNDISNITNNDTMFDDLTIKLYNQTSTLEDKLI